MSGDPAAIPLALERAGAQCAAHTVSSGFDLLARLRSTPGLDVMRIQHAHLDTEDYKLHNNAFISALNLMR